jgi:hypothetical protein
LVVRDLRIRVLFYAGLFFRALLLSIRGYRSGFFLMVLGLILGSANQLQAQVAPAVTSQPLALQARYDTPFSLSVVASGTPPLAYQWFRDDEPISGATSASFSRSTAALVDAGSYRVIVSNSVGSVVSNGALVSVIEVPPAIVVAPSGLDVSDGDGLSLTAAAAGSPPLAYRWFRDGFELSGATGTSLRLEEVGIQDAGQYTVAVTNPYGAATSLPARVTVAVAPKIQTSPFRLDVSRGNPAEFSVSAAGDGSLRYQWFKDGIQIPGATNSTFRIASAQVADAGLYSVEVGNRGGWTSTRPVGTFGVGFSHALYIQQDISSNSLSDGVLLAAGRNNYGQLGVEGIPYAELPVVVASQVKSVSAGIDHSLFIRADGSLWAMGWNVNGQLGDGTTTNRTLPVRVARPVASAAAGMYHSLYVRPDGTLWGMGANYFGQLGDGTTTDRLRPVRIADGVDRAWTWGNASIFIKRDGSCWYMGRFTSGLPQVTPKQVIERLTVDSLVTDVPIKAISAQVVGGSSAYALWVRPDGSLVGSSDDGLASIVVNDPKKLNVVMISRAYLGGYNWLMRDGTMNEGLITADPNPVHAIAGTHETFFFLQRNRNLWGLGLNDYGQLGIGNRLRQSSATKVAEGVLVEGAQLSVASVLTPQSILFGVIPERNFGSAPFSLSAASTSGLPVVFEVVSGPAVVSGSMLTITGAGVVTVRASQPGNLDFLAAAPVQRTFSAGRATPVIVWPPPLAVGAGAILANAQLNATSSVAGTFSYSPAAGTVLQSGLQTLSVTFTPNDAVNYQQVTQSVVISVNPPPPQINGPAVVSATVGKPFSYQISASGNPILFAASGLPAGLELDVVTGLISGVPQTQGKLLVSLTASNPGGTSSAFALDLTIAERPPGPVIIQASSNVTIPSGERTQLKVSATGASPLTYQWYTGSSGGTSSPVAGATSPTFTTPTLAATTSYWVRITDANGGVTNSPTVTVTVSATSPLTVTQQVLGTSYVQGGGVIVTNTITYTGTAPSRIDWSTLLPAGWKYLGSGGSEGGARPAYESGDLLEWSWTTVPASPIKFTYMVSVPAGTTGDQVIASLVTSQAAGTSYQTMAKPDPLVVRSASLHSADTNRDGRIGLLELTRVIELYNYRSGTSRTGQYHVQEGTEDGFAPGP